MSRRALVTGAAGQDGWYLVEHLLARGYEVHAQGRARPERERRRGLTWHAGDVTDPDFLRGVFTAAAPDEIYNLASVSRPHDSWTRPDEALVVDALVPQQLCELMLALAPRARLFQATSSEIFGDAKLAPQGEDSPLHPQTPYATAKAHAHLTVGAYRRRHGLHASSGIMFNHESPRRPLAYVSQKIAHAAAALSLGLRDTREPDELGQPILKNGWLRLGNLDVRRDFGFAGDYVEIMHLMLQAETPDDYVIGTGVSRSIGELCALAFRGTGRDWKEHVVVDQALVRTIDSRHTEADTGKLVGRFGWRAKTDLPTLVAMMVEHQVKALKEAPRR
jgi:GDPmannose 4,6-dehydratase